jgi:hypothetical protein
MAMIAEASTILLRRSDHQRTPCRLSILSKAISRYAPGAASAAPPATSRPRCARTHFSSALRTASVLVLRRTAASFAASSTTRRFRICSLEDTVFMRIERRLAASIRQALRSRQGLLSFLARGCLALKTAVLGVGFSWISLDSLVRIETFQWITRGLRE